MRHALVIAGGSGTRLWPMSRAALPKQLIPFIQGRSLLQIALERLEGLVPSERRYICALEAHREAVSAALPGFDPANYIAEPMGRDTLNAVALGAAVIARRDPDAVIAVFTADHVIEPAERFRQVVERGYRLAEERPDVLVTFGITPTHAATGYGYLQLGEPMGGEGARRVERFKEKPDAATAAQYLAAGPSQYLWNSGMFVWRAATLMDCVRRFAPENAEGIERIAAAWETPRRGEVLAETYPSLKKVSVDYAIMEPASQDARVSVAAVPMELTWLDVGSWPSFAQTCERDEHGNAVAAKRAVLLDCRDTLAATSDPEHVIAAIGCEGLLIVHTPDATLVCRADRAEDIKKLHAVVGERYGKV